MQLIDRNAHTTHFYGLLAPLDGPARTASSPQSVVSARLLVILGAALLAVAGPSILNTLAQASFVSIRILLELCNFGRIAFQIFGR